MTIKKLLNSKPSNKNKLLEDSLKSIQKIKIKLVTESYYVRMPTPTAGVRG